MSRAFQVLLFTAALVMAAPSLSYSDGSPSQITIGFIPGEAPEQLKKNTLDIAKLLQKKLGIPVNIYISKNYQGLIDAMKEKKIDFAFFTAMSFVFAEKTAGAKVLLKKVWKEPFYYSLVVAKKDSGIKKISDLKNKTMAFVDEKSTSGYLYPKLMMKKKGIDAEKFFKKIVFVGNHEAAVKAVLEGKVDAAAIFSDDLKGKGSAWMHYVPEKFGQQVILWTSDPIPNDPFCVREDFYEKYTRLTHDMMFALIDLKSDNESENVLLKLLGVQELKLATSGQYEPVREVVRELSLKIE